MDIAKKLFYSNYLLNQEDSVEIREVLLSTAANIIYGSPTKVERRIGGGFLALAILAPRIIDNAASHVIGTGRNSIDQILALSGNNSSEVSSAADTEPLMTE